MRLEIDYSLTSSYRRILRNAYRAVSYSQPASTLAHRLVRASFEDKSNTLDPKKISRTGYFLHKASMENGIEHKIVRNLLMTKYWKDYRAHLQRQKWRQIVDGMENPQGPNTGSKKFDPIADTAYDHYKKTIELFNERAGTALPTNW